MSDAKVESIPSPVSLVPAEEHEEKRTSEPEEKRTFEHHSEPRERVQHTNLEDQTVGQNDEPRESTATELGRIVAIKSTESQDDDDEVSEFIVPEVTAIQDEDFHKSMHYLKQQLEQEEAKQVDMEQFKINEKDSNDPSYTHLVLPYRVICRQRYRRAGAKQRAQFIKEIKQHELLQSKALDGIRIHREFCNAIISQPRPEETIKLTDKQKLRLEWIMKNEIR